MAGQSAFGVPTVIDPQAGMRTRLAESLIAQSQAPVAYNGIVSPYANLAKILTSFAGPYLLAKEGERQKADQLEVQGVQEQALRAAKGWSNPDTAAQPAAPVAGDVGPFQPGAGPLPPGATPVPPGAKTPGGGYDALAAVLASNPKTAPMGVQIQFQQMQAQQALANELAKARQGKMLDLEFDPQIAGSKKRAEVAPTLDLKKGEKELDLAYDPRRAAAIATAENPALIGRATAIHAGNVGTDVRNAEALAANRALGEGRANLTPVQVGGVMQPLAEALSGVRARGSETGQAQAKLAPTPNPNAPGAPSQPTAQVLAQATETGQQAAQGGQQATKAEDDLRKEFEAQAGVKNYREVVKSFNTIADASTRDNRASDLTMIYNVAKMLDPSGVVREQDAQMVINASSITERVKSYVASVVGGGKLSPEQRADLLNEASGLLGANKATHDQMADRYEGLARDRKVEPSRVVERVKIADAFPTITADERGETAYKALKKGQRFFDPTGALRIKP